MSTTLRAHALSSFFPHIRMKKMLTIAFGSLLLAACNGSVDGDIDVNGDLNGNGSVSSPMMEDSSAMMDSSESSVMMDSSLSSSMSSYPNAVMEVRSDFATEMNVNESNVEVISVVPMEWNDACLGAAEKDEVCAQVIVQGYVVTLRSGTTTYVYHTNQLGTTTRRAQ